MPFLFPRFATRPLFSYQSAAVRHGFCLAEDVLSTTELWTRCALAVRCEAFGSYSALSELRLISPEDGFPPLVAELALFVLRHGAGGCFAQGVA